MKYTLKDLVRPELVARFRRYRKGELVYAICAPLGKPEEDLFEFPVPVSDTGDGVFNAEERSMTLMRYIRKALEAATEEE
jgi:hypothetical protein